MFRSLLRTVYCHRCLNSAVQRLMSSSDEFPKNVPRFSSGISLDKLYPKSNTHADTATVEPPKTDIKFSGYIPMEAVEVKFSRSSGPGGQHINKTESKVQVSFHLESAEWIPVEIRHKLADLHKNSISKDGIWSVKSEKTRYQSLNLADCMDKLRSYITEANIIVPQPDFETLELKRKRAEKAANARLRDKRMYSMRKQMQTNN